MCGGSFKENYHWALLLEYRLTFTITICIDCKIASPGALKIQRSRSSCLFIFFLQIYYSSACTSTISVCKCVGARGRSQCVQECVRQRVRVYGEAQHYSLYWIYIQIQIWLQRTKNIQIQISICLYRKLARTKVGPILQIQNMGLGHFVQYYYCSCSQIILDLKSQIQLLLINK